MSKRILVSAVTLAGVVVIFALAREVSAASLYPTNKCVSTKLKAVSTKCKADLKAWSGWDNDQDDVKRDGKLAAAAGKLTQAWVDAQDKSTASGADCTETTLSSAGMAALVDATVNDIVTTINGGLNLTNDDDGKCGGALIKAASAKCAAFLKAESSYIKKRASDPPGAGRTAAQLEATNKFSMAWSAVIGCPTTATMSAIETKVDQLSADALLNSTISPNVPQGTWTMITPPTSIDYEGKTLQPICSRDTPYAYWVRRGTNNKLLVYYQGGGACWDGTTCAAAVHAFDDTVTAGDSPANFTAGFGDLGNGENPFSDWNAVFISYCTGDVHWGDQTTFYQTGALYGNYTIQHKGFENAKVVEKWAREHFLDPEEVFVTGSSAGAYGAILHGLLLPQVYPAAHFDVLGDAGNGVITPTFLKYKLNPSWGVEQNLPTFIPNLDKPIDQLSIVDLWAEGANFYPNANFAQYTSAFDGGSGSQTFFYSVMVDGIPNGLNWWNQSCNWNSLMEGYVTATASGAPNYRYYVGSGSRHTMWGTDKVYDPVLGTLGGTPRIVDWLDAMLASTPSSPDPGWINTECTTCNAVPGTCSAGSDNPGASCQDDVDCPNGTCQGEDTRPSPLAEPFEPGGVINCP